ncbi:MAG: glucose-phosphate thymidylyltransferase [Gemmatimonadetes bacterium]|jgi:dTDP-glucose pyrophosphorylase|nr:glucose-phosphate thymidylyltransferase [Gemmatimonadota bacterium]
MRKADAGATLDAAQAAAAGTGVKGMIPIGRPFLDYLVSAFADAGFTDVCLVIGPEHDAVRQHYAAQELTRIRVHFAVQAKPLGTADAVLAAEGFARGEPFVVINSDNHYPRAALEALHGRRTPATVGFAHETLTRLGNVPADRIARFGAMQIDADGRLQRILVTPSPEMVAAGDLYASLNCWLFTSAIFDACRTVPPSARGELELPQAVELAIAGGMQVDVIRMEAPVLDMSSRADIASVAERLRGVRVEL